MPARRRGGRERGLHGQRSVRGDHPSDLDGAV